MTEPMPPPAPVTITTLSVNNRDHSPLGLVACSGAVAIFIYEKKRTKQKVVQHEIGSLFVFLLFYLIYSIDFNV
jgi:hypothetical protein